MKHKGGGVEVHGRPAAVPVASATSVIDRRSNVSGVERSSSTTADHTGRVRTHEEALRAGPVHRSGRERNSTSLPPARRTESSKGTTRASCGNLATSLSGTEAQPYSRSAFTCSTAYRTNSDASERHSTPEPLPTTKLDSYHLQSDLHEESNARFSRGIPTTELSAGCSGKNNLPSPMHSIVREYPFTEPVLVSAIVTHIHERMEWNRAMRQLIFAIPLLFLFAALYVGHRVDPHHANVYHTQVIRQVLERSPFPSAAVELERFRQHRSLGAKTPPIRPNRVFENIQSQTDWIEFFTDVVIPNTFPGVAGLVNGSRSTHSAHTSVRQRIRMDKNHLRAPTSSSHNRERSDVSFDVGNRGRYDPAKSSDSSVASAMGRTRNGKSKTLATDIPPTKSLQEDEIGVIAGEHIFLGALRTRTIRMRAHTAELQRPLYPPESVMFPRDGWSRRVDRIREDTSPFRCPSLTLTNPLNGSSTPVYIYKSPDEAGADCVPTTGRWGKYHCGGYTFDIPFRSPAWLVTQYRAAVGNQSCLFLDNWATRYVVLEFFTYTPSTDSFHLVKYRTEVSAAGSYLNNAVYHSFPIWTPERTEQLVFVCFTAAYTAVYMCSFVARVYEKIRHCGTVFEVLLDSSVWIDLGALVSLLVSFIYYYLWRKLSIAVAPQLVAPMHSNTYPAFLDSVEQLYEQHTISAAIAGLFCTSRLCTLRVVLRPLDLFLRAVERSAAILVALAAVFLVVVLAYALVGWAVFGPFSDFYRTFDESLYTCLTLWTSVNLIFPASDNLNSLFTFLFFVSLLFVFGVVIVSLGVATMLHAFAKGQDENGVLCDEDWLMSSLQKLKQWLTWARLKRFGAMILDLHNESHSLAHIAEHTAVMDHFSCPRTVISKRTGHRQGASTAVSRERLGCDVEEGELSTSFPLKDNEKQLSGAVSVLRTSCHLEATATSFRKDSHVTQASCNPASQYRSHLSTSLSAPEEKKLPLSGPEASNTAPQLHTSSIEPTIHRSCEDLRKLSSGARAMGMSSFAAPSRINFFDWISMIPSDSLRKCGGVSFFAEMWTGWIESQAEISQTPGQQTRQLFQEETALATERAVASSIAAISQFDATLTQFETHVDMLLHSVSLR